MLIVDTSTGTAYGNSLHVQRVNEWPQTDPLRQELRRLLLPGVAGLTAFEVEADTDGQQHGGAVSGQGRYSAVGGGGRFIPTPQLLAQEQCTRWQCTRCKHVSHPLQTRLTRCSSCETSNSDYFVVFAG